MFHLKKAAIGEVGMLKKVGGMYLSLHGRPPGCSDVTIQGSREFYIFGLAT